MTTAPQSQAGGFLPDDYEPPSGSRFMRPSKLPEGETQVRILDNPLVGWQAFWEDADGKKHALCSPMSEKLTQGSRPEGCDGPLDKVSHVWWMPAWDYRGKQVVLIEARQQQIQTKLTTLSRSRWGSPLGYDVSLVHKGTGLDSEYDVIPMPASPLPADVQQAWATAKADGFNLAAVFSGGNPFEPGATPGAGAAAAAQVGFADAPKDELSALRGQFFAILTKLVKRGVYGATMTAGTDEGKAERRKLLSTLLLVPEGQQVDPAKFETVHWQKAVEAIKRVDAGTAPPDDVPFF